MRLGRHITAFAVLTVALAMPGGPMARHSHSQARTSCRAVAYATRRALAYRNRVPTISSWCRKASFSL
jgi:hypothetical protein